MAAQRALLSGGRWHFQHGPMDIVLGAEGRADVVAAAHERAWRRFEPLLGELVAELPLLRQPVRAGECLLHGAVARRMWQACAPHRGVFITPMAAVAGAVAQELAACYGHEGIERAWVNNGGDIALHLSPASSVRIGLFADLARFGPEQALASLQGGLATDGQFEITHAMPVRGVATSGWRGRSFSLGIADSVTVLAATAAEADAAASMIANAVDVDDARIVRLPARDVKDDSDLGEIPVTVEVPALAASQVRRALAAGLRRAEGLRAKGLIADAVLVCQAQVVVTGGLAALPAAATAEVGSVFA